jgi:hypothetical protein
VGGCVWDGHDNRERTDGRVGRPAWGPGRRRRRARATRARRPRGARRAGGGGRAAPGRRPAPAPAPPRRALPAANCSAPCQRPCARVAGAPPPTTPDCRLAPESGQAAAAAAAWRQAGSGRPPHTRRLRSPEGTPTTPPLRGPGGRPWPRRGPGGGPHRPPPLHGGGTSGVTPPPANVLQLLTQVRAPAALRAAGRGRQARPSSSAAGGCRARGAPGGGPGGGAAADSAAARGINWLIRSPEALGGALAAAAGAVGTGEGGWKFARGLRGRPRIKPARRFRTHNLDVAVSSEASESRLARFCSNGAPPRDGHLLSRGPRGRLRGLRCGRGSEVPVRCSAAAGSGGGGGRWARPPAGLRVPRARSEPAAARPHADPAPTPQTTPRCSCRRRGAGGGRPPGRGLQVSARPARPTLLRATRLPRPRRLPAHNPPPARSQPPKPHPPTNPHPKTPKPPQLPLLH